MAERYYVRLHNGSFVGPSTPQEIRDAYAAGKLRWDFGVFPAEGQSPDQLSASAPSANVASLVGHGGRYGRPIVLASREAATVEIAVSLRQSVLAFGFILLVYVLGMFAALDGVPLPSASSDAGSVVKLLSTLLGLGYLVVFALGLIAVYRLASALKQQSPWLSALLMFVPLLNLLLLLSFISTATKYLRTNNVPVGLMGPRRTDIARLKLLAAQPTNGKQ